MNDTIVCVWFCNLLFSLNMFSRLLHVIIEIWLIIFDGCVRFNHGMTQPHLAAPAMTSVFLFPFFAIINSIINSISVSTLILLFCFKDMYPEVELLDYRVCMNNSF